MRRTGIAFGLAGVLLLSILAAPGAMAHVPVDPVRASYAGTNVGGPEWDRPIEAGPALSGLGPVRYALQPICITVSGTYEVLSVQDYDGYLHLYEEAFDPDDPLTNLLAGDDDGHGGIGTSELSALLSAGDHFIVTSAFANGQEGTFANDVHGPAPVALGPCAVSVEAIDHAVELGSALAAVATVDTPGATGDVRIDLFGPDDPTCAGPATFSGTVPLEPDGTATTSTTAADLGINRWTATYLGGPTPDASICGADGSAAVVVSRDRTVYGDAFEVGSATDHFVAFDVDSPGAVTEVSPITPTDHADAGDFGPDGLMYVVTRDNELQSVTSGGVRTTIATGLAPYNAGMWGGMAFATTVDTPAGTMYVTSSDGVDSRLDRIDLATGDLTPVGGTGLLGTPSVSSLGADGDGILFGLSTGDDTLYRIDVPSGVATAIGPIGRDSLGTQGMDWDAISETMFVTLTTGMSDSSLAAIDLDTAEVIPIDGVGDPHVVSWLAIPDTVPDRPVGPGGPGTPDPEDPVPPSPLDAEDNIDRAIAWSQVANPPSDATFAGTTSTVDTVLLARDDVFADSLASGGAQGLLDATLLLTGSDALDPRTEAEIERLAPTSITILGGENAVSPTVEAALIDAGYDTQRLFGPTRIETAIDIARALAPDGTAAIMARAHGSPGGDPTQAFADTIAGAVLGADLAVPLLLTETGQLSDSTRTYLSGSPIEEIWLLGGSAAIDPAVEAELDDMGITTRRLEGPTRFDTAVDIAIDGLDVADSGEATQVVLIDGQDPDAWADAYPAARLSVATTTPTVLSNGDDLPAPTSAWLVPTDAALICGSTTSRAACTAAWTEMQAP